VAARCRIAVFAVVRGMGVGHALEEASLVAVFALAAAHPGGGSARRWPCSA
jgi:hypothetical protein